MIKYIIIKEDAHYKCPFYEPLPCKNKFGFKVPYCTFQHPFKVLKEDEGIPEWCPLSVVAMVKRYCMNCKIEREMLEFKDPKGYFYICSVCLSYETVRKDLTREELNEKLS